MTMFSLLQTQKVNGKKIDWYMPKISEDKRKRAKETKVNKNSLKWYRIILAQVWKKKKWLYLYKQDGKKKVK